MSTYYRPRLQGFGAQAPAWPKQASTPFYETEPQQASTPFYDTGGMSYQTQLPGLTSGPDGSVPPPPSKDSDSDSAGVNAAFASACSAKGGSIGADGITCKLPNGSTWTLQGGVAVCVAGCTTPADGGTLPDLYSNGDKGNGDKGNGDSAGSSGMVIAAVGGLAVLALVLMR